MTEGKKKSLENLKKRKPFVKGDERINRKGANKGSRWKKTLLEELMTVDLSTSEVDAFNSIKQRFPSFFNGSHDQNFQLFLEVKQVSLSFSKDERVAQTAIEKIKDRIEGKSVQVVESTNKNYDMSDDDIKRDLEKLKAMRDDIESEGDTGIR